jgi:hypothetical protein
VIRTSGIKSGMTASGRALAFGALLAASGASGQEPQEASALIRSLGQPPVWRPYLSGGVLRERGEGGPMRGSAALGVERSLGNPLGGALTIGVDGYVHAGRDGSQSGMRALLHSPLFFVHGGLDRNNSLGRTDFVTGATLALRRGGWPITGSQVRVHWIPAREGTLEASLVLPLAQPLAGRTRPREVAVPMPRAERVRIDAGSLSDPEARAAWENVRVGMAQLISMLTFFWLIEERNVSYAASVEEWRDILADFGAEFFQPGITRPGVSQYQREAAAYHAALERVFAITAGPGSPPGAGAALAAAARRVALVEVMIPYNRTYGQYRKPNSLNGLNANAVRAFADSVQTLSFSASDTAEVIHTFALWLDDLERMRERIGRIARDPRMSWMPLGLVLRPDEHRTQSQIDELVTLLLERPFEPANAIFTIDAPQFQQELKRSIRETRRFHVLWVHDYRGVDEVNVPDRTSVDVTATYLRGLRDAALAYDSTGSIPAYFILVDQHFWEVTKGRMWMTLLERPLTHRLQLAARFEDTEQALRLLQDSLRAAVSGSARLQRDAARFGRRWLENRVKVHVNITNPADFTFRSRRIALPLGSDNLLRDHRKMLLRDADESDPSQGEVIFAGVGVGDHYASATWEDRAMIVRGPAVASTMRYLRATFERHRMQGSAMPEVLRPRPIREPDSARAALEGSGFTARVMQTHNEVGWGRKESSAVQMLLYDLAPAGTIIFVPDALWSSYQWMAQLVGAALRGCKVYIVAPGKQHAPASGFPWMSVQQELVTRAALIDEVLGEVIRAGGGDLRVGLYARTVPLDDYAYSLESVLTTWRGHPFLQEIIPLPDAVASAITALAEQSRAEPPALTFVPDARGRAPLLHRKTQWLLDENAVRAVTLSPHLPAALVSSVAAHRFGGVQGGMTDSLRMQAALEMVRLYSSVRGDSSDVPLYFTTGSINKNPRSMMVDAEVLGLVAGAWSFESYLDMLVLLASTSWVRSLADIERLLPPYSRQQRRLGRWLYPII